MVRFDDLKIPQAESYFVDVFVYPASLKFQDTAQFRDRYRVGRVGRFASAQTGKAAGHGTHGPHAPKGTVASVDVTDAVKALVKSSSNEANWKLLVEFSAYDVNKPYGSIASEVGLRHIALLRRDFASTEVLPLEAAQP